MITKGQTGSTAKAKQQQSENKPGLSHANTQINQHNLGDKTLGQVGEKVSAIYVAVFMMIILLENTLANIQKY